MAIAKLLSLELASPAYWTNEFKPFAFTTILARSRGHAVQRNATTGLLKLEALGYSSAAHSPRLKTVINFLAFKANPSSPLELVS